MYLESVHLERVDCSYGSRVRLCYTDTDSLLVQIQTDNINADLIDMADQFDFSDYPVNHPVRQTLGEEKIKANKKTPDHQEVTEVIHIACLLTIGCTL